jgi:homoserine O-acetyltransferase
VRNEKGEITNAVLLLHWTSASGGALQTPEFATSLYAPGKPLDAAKYFLIFIDNVGHGRSSKPSDGVRARFPKYGYLDMVDLQHRLITEKRGIKRLRAIVGLSMGGMHAWLWAENHPDAVEAIMPIVALPARIGGQRRSPSPAKLSLRVSGPSGGGRAHRETTSRRRGGRG